MKFNCQQFERKRRIFGQNDDKLNAFLTKEDFIEEKKSRDFLRFNINFRVKFTRNLRDFSNDAVISNSLSNVFVDIWMGHANNNPSPKWPDSLKVIGFMMKDADAIANTLKSLK